MPDRTSPIGTSIPVVSSDAPAPRRDPHADDWHVLIVDEAPSIRKKLSEILTQAQAGRYQISVAASAEEALETFALSRPNLVMTELVGERPEEGLAMITEMLHIDQDIKIVLVTAESPDSPVVRGAIRRGVFAVVQKPIRHEKIRQLLMEIQTEDSGLARFR